MLATIAYRGAKAIRGAPESFGTYGAPESPRTPVKILAHMGDLFDWALSIAQGNQKWNNFEPLPWPQEAARFFAALEAFDSYLASDQPMQCSIEGLLQAPVADCLTHIGQLTMLRRMAGCPIKGENYHRADIVAGRVGMDQAAPRREFD